MFDPVRDFVKWLGFAHPNTILTIGQQAKMRALLNQLNYNQVASGKTFLLALLKEYDDYHDGRISAPMEEEKCQALP